MRLKCDGTRAETRFRLSAKRTSPFKSSGASVQSTTGSRGVCISGTNAGYTMFRGSVKSTGYPLHSPVSPSIPLSVRHRVPSHFNWTVPLLTKCDAAWSQGPFFHFSISYSELFQIFTASDHRQWHRQADGRTPLDEASRPSQIPLPHNTHRKEKSTSATGFETANPASERPNTHALSMPKKQPGFMNHRTKHEEWCGKRKQSLFTTGRRENTSDKIKQYKPTKCNFSKLVF